MMKLFLFAVIAAFVLSAPFVAHARDRANEEDVGLFLSPMVIMRM